MALIHVDIKKSQLQKWHRWAKKHYPLEIIAAMLGTRTVDGYSIECITPPCIGEPTQVEFDDVTWAEVRRPPRESGLRYLGTIHTHPDESSQPQPSTYDIHATAKSNEKIYAITAVWKKAGKLHVDTEFYTSGPAIKVSRL